MGLVLELVSLPLAPLRGAGWCVGQVLAEARRQYHDPETVRAELAALERRLAAGEIGEAEFDRLEDALLDRLEEGGAT